MASKTFVFDAYGTLFDVHSATRALKDEIGPEFERLSQLWRQRQLEYTWVYSMAGVQKSFWTLTKAALDFAAESVGGVAPELRQKLLDAYETLEPYPEVKAALGALKKAKCRSAILSNGDLDMLTKAVRSTGLDGLIDLLLSAQEVGVFKTSGRVYRLAPAKLGVPKEVITFVSSNRWDVAGARVFGFETVWVNRSGAVDEYTDLPAHRMVASLSELSDRQETLG